MMHIASASTKLPRSQTQQPRTLTDEPPQPMSHLDMTITRIRTCRVGPRSNRIIRIVQPHGANRAQALFSWDGCFAERISPRAFFQAMQHSSSTAEILPQGWIPKNRILASDLSDAIQSCESLDLIWEYLPGKNDYFAIVADLMFLFLFQPAIVRDPVFAQSSFHPHTVPSVVDKV
jgi:hypothetical protein